MPEFGQWLPDLPPYGHEGLVMARNVYASPLGYRPIKALSAVTSALPEAWKGGGSFVGPDGTTVMLAGSNGGLYAYSGSWTNKYSGSYTSRWDFAQFGSFVVAVNGGAPLKYDIATATASLLGGSPPSSTMAAVVRDFVFLAGDSAANSTVYWSAINNAEGWTVGTNQSDKQMLPDGGAITGLAGGEFGLVFQESAIHRFSYVGTPLIFQRDKISESIGCITPGAVAQFGRIAFFLSGRGFYAITDGGLSPIGQDKVDATFWGQYSRADVANNIRATVDPKRSLVIWSMPDRLWIYNWVLERWTDVAIPGLSGLSTGLNASVSLESIDTLYPGGIETVPYSLDDPIFQGGEPLLTLVKTDNVIYSLGSSSNLQATLEMANLEFYRGRTARVRRARLDSDAVSGLSLSLSTSNRLGDPKTVVEAHTITDSGHTPIRAFARYIQPRIDLAAGTTWTYAKGIDFEAAPGGRQ